jgi:hypothetical protein
VRYTFRPLLPRKVEKEFSVPSDLKPAKKVGNGLVQVE